MTKEELEAMRAKLNLLFEKRRKEQEIQNKFAPIYDDTYYAAVAAMDSDEEPVVTRNTMQYKEEIRALIARWDMNEDITVVQMGGLGGGYERAIYATMFCMLREVLRRVDAGEDFDAVIKGGGKALWLNTNKDPDFDGGITGAMFGAACNAMGMFVHNGYQGGLDMAKEQGVDPDRFITIRRGTPRVQ